MPGHEDDCECGTCEVARMIPEATVPDDFAIHRHRDLPMYVVTFSRTDVPDDGVRVLLQAHMLSSIGSLMIEHSLDDTASFMIGDDHDDD